MELEIGGAEEISDRELVHARASLLSVWFGQEDCWKYCFWKFSIVIPAEMHNRGREASSLLGHRSVSCSEK